MSYADGRGPYPPAEVGPWIWLALAVVVILAGIVLVRV
jgi:hypothetical protein